MSSTLVSSATAVVTGGAALTPTLSPEAFAARAAESNLPFILGMIIPFFVIAFISVALRTYVRARVVKVMGIDDWIMLAAMVSLSSLPILRLHYYGSPASNFGMKRGMAVGSRIGRTLQKHPKILHISNLSYLCRSHPITLRDRKFC